MLPGANILQRKNRGSGLNRGGSEDERAEKAER
jgi:hypothetical protein